VTLRPSKPRGHGVARAHEYCWARSGISHDLEARGVGIGVCLPALRSAPVGYTHDVRARAQLDDFVAINEVPDLSGQANVEMLEGCQVSGTGGLLDFVRRARLSKDGRSILAQSVTGSRTGCEMCPTCQSW
jgi:Acetyl-CoA hydrolase/transferase C-terminal domain